MADITYRNVPRSGWLDGEIQKGVARLAACCPHILSCRVLVELPHRHHEQGNRYHVRIDMTVPGETISAGRLRSPHALPAFRQACLSARRQLKEYACRRRRVRRVL